MKQFTVSFSYRPNANRSERKVCKAGVWAQNKQEALILAGWRLAHEQLHLKNEGVVAGSVLDVEISGRPA